MPLFAPLRCAWVSCSVNQGLPGREILAAHSRAVAAPPPWLLYAGHGLVHQAFSCVSQVFSSSSLLPQWLALRPRYSHTCLIKSLAFAEDHSPLGSSWERCLVLQTSEILVLLAGACPLHRQLLFDSRCPVFSFVTVKTPLIRSPALSEDSARSVHVSCLTAPRLGLLAGVSRRGWVERCARC